jgi:hypothetical protein
MVNLKGFLIKKGALAAEGSPGREQARLWREIGRK